MASLDEAKSVLFQALEMEKKAEQNCQQILELLRANGFTSEIEHIKDDEKKHQGIVQQLLDFL